MCNLRYNLWVNYLQISCRNLTTWLGIGIMGWNSRVPDLQISCKDLIISQVYRYIGPFEWLLVYMSHFNLKGGMCMTLVYLTHSITEQIHNVEGLPKQLVLLQVKETHTQANNLFYEIVYHVPDPRSRLVSSCVWVCNHWNQLAFLSLCKQNQAISRRKCFCVEQNSEDLV